METKSFFKPVEIREIEQAKEKLLAHLADFKMTVQKISSKTDPIIEHCYVSGGCIGSLLRGEVPKDYDIYFRNEASAKKVTNLYLNDFPGEIETVSEKYREVVKTVSDDKSMCITENAMTLKNQIQLITKHYGEPSEIRKTFDFKHCLPYYDFFNDKLYISPEQFNLNVRKFLAINNQSSYTVWREEKFKSRGWLWQ